MTEGILEAMNQRKEEEKNDHYNEAYKMAYEEMEEIILDFMCQDTNDNAINQVLGYVKGKLDMISQYKVDFLNIKIGGK